MTPYTPTDFDDGDNDCDAIPDDHIKLASKTNKGGGPHLGSRYKCDALDEDLCDFSRDDDLCG